MVTGPLKSPASLKVHTSKLDVSNTAESLATISRVNIDILPSERRDSLKDGLVRENELEGKCGISQVKEKLQDGTKPSTHPRNLIPTWSSGDVAGGRNDRLNPLQPLNTDQKPKDQVSDMHEVLVSER